MFGKFSNVPLDTIFFLILIYARFWVASLKYWFHGICSSYGKNSERLYLLVNLGFSLANL